MARVAMVDTVGNMTFEWHKFVTPEATLAFVADFLHGQSQATSEIRRAECVELPTGSVIITHPSTDYGVYVRA